MRRRRQAYEHKAAQGSASEGAACTVSRSTAARPRVPSTISGSSSDRATASANPTADRALDRPRLVPPERADLRPLSQWRSGVAVRSLDKPSGDTSERAMTRRVSTSRADATPCGPRHQKEPPWKWKNRMFLTSEALPTRFHGASEPPPRASETYLTASTLRYVSELQLPRRLRTPAPSELQLPRHLRAPAPSEL